MKENPFPPAGTIDIILVETAYDKVSCEFNKRVPTAKKLITRPIMIFYHGHNCPYILKVGWFSCPAKKLTKSPPLTQPNFTKWLRFLAIFHRPWVCQGLWKIEKPQYFCTVWAVELWDWKKICPVHFSKNEKIEEKNWGKMEKSKFWKKKN